MGGLNNPPDTFSRVLILDGAGHYLQLPSLTTAERNALTAVNGMQIYNTTTSQIEIYQNATWVGLGTGAGGVFLPLAGGTMSGNIAMAGAQTVDGVDISAHTAAIDAHMLDITTITQAIAFLKARPRQNISVYTSAGLVLDLTAGGGGAWAQGAHLGSAATGANANATIGGVWQPNLIRPPGDNQSNQLINWDKWFILDMLWLSENSVADCIRYVKLSQDTTHADLGSKGIGVKMANFTAQGDVYDASLHSQAGIFTAVISTIMRLSFVHIPTVGEYILKDLAQVMADTTNLLSGNAGAASSLLISTKTGATASSVNLAVSQMNMFFPLIL